MLIFCPKCQTDKGASDFQKNSKRKNGLQAYCKTCTNDARRANYNANLEQERKRRRDYSASPRGREVNKKWEQTEAGLRYRSKAASEWKRKNPEKHRAHTIVDRALRLGRLVKRPCERCGALRAEAHHDDYALPLQVMWLCNHHHKERHRELRVTLSARV